MRRYSIAEALFPSTRRRLLAAMLLNSQKPWYAAELARHLKMPRTSLQRDLARLASSGVLKTSSAGNLAYFQPDETCPVFSELRAIFLKTTGLIDVLREELSPLAARIKIAAVYGSIAAGADAVGSDVDLLMVGAVDLMELVPMLEKATSKLGRQVNPTIYTPEDFKQKADKSRFIQSVLGKSLLFVLGKLDELETIAGRKAGSPGADRQGGN